MEFNNSQPGSQQTQANVFLANPVLVTEQRDLGTGRSKYSSKYSRVSSLFFGIVQILLAVLSVTGAVFAVVFDAYACELGTGFWCGLVYGIAGCLATVASGCPTNPLIVTVAVFSFLCIPFGITAMVLGSIGVSGNTECDYETCLTGSPFGMAGNALVTTTGFYEIVFGICLFVISIRAIRKSSKAQVTAVAQVYYSTNSPESIQMNNTAHNQQVASNVYNQNQQQQQEQHWTTQPNSYVAQEQRRY